MGTDVPSASGGIRCMVCGVAELAMHLTGRYADWWAGKRFDKPVRAWAAGVTNESTRDVVQEKLIGPPFDESKWGTGLIPKAALAEVAPARGLPGMIDTVAVKHASGGNSMLQFKSYERGREKWQGAALEVVWFDEEPPEDIYTEGLTRTNETGGAVYVTFTPLQGASEVVQRFLNVSHPDRHIVQATIDDAGHFTAEDKAKTIGSYKKHELAARTKGVPLMGSGLIFPINEDLISCERRDIPKHWPRLGAMDFGWTHPFAAVELAWDRDTDTVYVVRCHRLSEATPIMHAAAVKPWGKLPWAWPRDGNRETLEGAGIALAKQYAAQGLDMIDEHAQFEPDGHVRFRADRTLSR